MNNKYNGTYWHCLKYFELQKTEVATLLSEICMHVNVHQYSWFFLITNDKSLYLTNFHDVMQIYSVFLNTNLNSNLILTCNAQFIILPLSY